MQKVSAQRQPSEPRNNRSRGKRVVRIDPTRERLPGRRRERSPGVQWIPNRRAIGTPPPPLAPPPKRQLGESDVGARQRPNTSRPRGAWNLFIQRLRSPGPGDKTFSPARQITRTVHREAAGSPRAAGINRNNKSRKPARLRGITGVAGAREGGALRLRTVFLGTRASSKIPKYLLAARGAHGRTRGNVRAGSAGAPSRRQLCPRAAATRGSVKVICIGARAVGTIKGKIV